MKIAPLIKPEYGQQPGETIVAHAAFTAYLNMPDTERSIRDLARTLGKSATLIAGWSARWQWQERVKAWGVFKRKEAEAAQRKVAEAKAREWGEREQATREREWQKGEELMAKVDQMLKLPIITQKKTVEEERNEAGQVVKIINTTIVNPARWDWGTITRMIETASKLQRLAVGLNTDKTEHSVTPVGVGGAQVVLYLPDNGMRKAGAPGPEVAATRPG